LNSPEIKKFIKENSHLFWYINQGDKEQLSIGVVVETILNYGNRESIKKLFDLVGIKKVSEVFEEQLSNNRNNYFPPVKNYFQLYFTRHVQRDIK